MGLDPLIVISYMLLPLFLYFIASTFSHAWFFFFFFFLLVFCTDQRYILIYIEIELAVILLLTFPFRALFPLDYGLSILGHFKQYGFGLDTYLP